MERICQNCEYFIPRPFEASNAGICRRMPPMFTGRAYLGKDTADAHARTTLTWWCGEFRPNREKCETCGGSGVQTTGSLVGACPGCVGKFLGKF